MCYFSPLLILDYLPWSFGRVALAKRLLPAGDGAEQKLRSPDIRSAMPSAFPSL